MAFTASNPATSGVGVSNLTLLKAINDNFLSIDANLVSTVAYTPNDPSAAGGPGCSELTLLRAINDNLISLGQNLSVELNMTAYSVLANPTASSAPAIATQTLTLGTPAVVDTGVGYQLTGSVAGYYQGILQNTSANAAASADLIVQNNAGTSTTFYGDFGMNSSTFTGTGSLSLANAVYLFSQSGDLVIGTNTANAIHFVVNNGATDVLTITTTGQLAAAVGAVGTPSLTFTGDLNTGLYWISADRLGLTVGGVQTADFGSATGITLTALGTNQTITLTPNGTGYVTVPTPSGSGVAGGFLVSGNSNTIRLSPTVIAGANPGIWFNDAGSPTATNCSLTGSSTTTVLNASSTLLLRTGNSTGAQVDSSHNFTITQKLVSYNAIATAGWGVPAIYAAGRVTAQSAANASIATYTVGAADGSFEVSANLNCTVTTTLVTTLSCTYTDEASNVRTMIFPIQQLSGSFIALGAITGLGAWETPVMHIRCKASTAITIFTAAGTFTGVTYTAEGIIRQLA